MKKILLLAAAALMVTTASAQLKPAQKQTNARPQMMRQMPKNLMKEAQMREPGAPVAKAPKKAGTLEPMYQRPAGAFPGNMFVTADGTLDGMAYASYIFMKPYAEYTFHGIAEGASENVKFEWDVQQYGYNDAGEYVQQWFTYAPEGSDLDVTYDWEVDSVPSMWVQDEGKWYNWFMRGHQMNGTSIVSTYFSNIMACPAADEIFSDIEEGGNLIVCSKNTCFGGLKGDQEYPFTYYSGMDPYGANDNGWWFGKNGGTTTRDGVTRTLRMDGIAQAFEKPSHPYLLRSVFLDCAVLEVTEQVDLTCKIYKLDEIPAYDENDAVALPEEPGELIATGRATLVPGNDMLVKFTVFDEEDGLEVEYTPTIDYPILVTVEGYNEPDMAGLKDFSALIVSDDHTDEGFGELAYLKRGINDEDGNFTGRYVWEGLNHFFGGDDNTMMTGLTIFLDIQNPFLTFSYSDLEDGEFTFPNEGGLMEKVLYEEGSQQLVTRSIRFFSYMPSVDEGWTLTCNGEDVPEWLDIELIDEMKGEEFTGNVTAVVNAEPLPEGTPYREAVVRFEFPGAYLDYKFMQGEKPDFNIYDVNRDNEVNIADVNFLINMILTENTSSVGDVNSDSEVNIADVNALIDYILKH
jgi:hypothetical protein